MRATSIAVFCGARSGRDPKYLALARRVGELLAQDGLRLVYGGGRVGLMGALADGALMRGGQVLGIIPEKLIELEPV
ncbi:MAG: TIGR00730 family Rossman fold protein, partial [Bdellovibrionaceae bacterium]|nr:TIGR00730 family Rossman fold protein [Pseudobdellovibrionaceae bacterium]